MANLNEWVDKNTRRPLLRLFILSLGVIVGYFSYLIHSRYAEQMARVELARESVSLGVQQSNRPLIEAAMMSLLSDTGFSAVALCAGEKAEIYYPLEHPVCNSSKKFSLHWTIKRPIVGVAGRDIAVKLSPLAAFGPLLLLVLIAAAALAAVVWSAMGISGRLRAEVLEPLAMGLETGVPLSIEELETLRRHTQERAELMSRQAASEAMVLLSAQVAHDIRSPLAALSVAAKGLNIPEEQRTLVDGALGRMQGIANDLLARYRAPDTKIKPKIEACALAGMIDQVLTEKRLQHREKAGLKIEFNAGPDSLKATVDAKEFQRIISNLVNNSIEAFSGPGIVAVSLVSADSQILLEIKDNGKGIPPELLARLGQKGETHGKAGGTGLGLYHARTTVENWGGTLKIASDPGKGTTVAISLPAAARHEAGPLAVLLDDDSLVHMNWKLAAKAAGVELKAYKIPEDFAAGIETLPRDTPIYIDSDLGNGVKGENIAIELHAKGFTALTMATGHGSEEFAPLPWLKATGKEPPWGA